MNLSSVEGDSPIFVPPGRDDAENVKVGRFGNSCHLCRSYGPRLLKSFACGLCALSSGKTGSDESSRFNDRDEAFWEGDTMRGRGILIIAAMLATVLASEAQIAPAGQPGPLGALADRQALHDEVCIAMAKGYISRGDRYAILAHGKDLLKPAEYEGLKRAIDRLSPPKPFLVESSTAVAKGSPTGAKPTAQVASKQVGLRRAPMPDEIQAPARSVADLRSPIG